MRDVRTVLDRREADRVFTALGRDEREARVTDETLTLYETPEGVISVSAKYGRREIRVYRARSGLINVKIISRPRDGASEFYQIFALNSEMAGHVGNLLNQLASHAPVTDDKS